MLSFFIFISGLFSLAEAGTSWEIKILPATPYLFQEINAPIAQNRIKDLQLKAHTHVDALALNAKKYPAKFEPRFFYRIDVVKFQLLDVGQIVLKESEKIPADKIRTFPGGRYFVINFEGPGSKINETFSRITDLLKEAGVEADSPVITYYKKSALNFSSEKIQIFIKLKNK